MTSQQPISESLSRKRARDRRAQQNVRDKRNAHFQTLEQRIITLERELQASQQRCHSLICENETLRGRQRQMKHLVTSWTSHTRPQVVDPVDRAAADSTLGTADGLLSLRTQYPIIREDDDESQGIEPHPPPVSSKPADLQAILFPRLDHSGPPPLWNMTPVCQDPDYTVTRWIALCMRDPDLVRNSAEIPQPIELLYGSKTNFLANAIHDGARCWPCRDPERLAAGWLSYRLVKWMFQPSEFRFAHLRDFQKPVDDELCSPHPYYIGFIFWPALRTNLIRLRHAYDSEDFLGLFACCLKLRWPWNESVLEPRDNGDLVLRAEFYDTFTKLEGWGLTKEFIDRFPSLFKGIDTSSILYELV